MLWLFARHRFLKEAAPVSIGACLAFGGCVVLVPCQPKVVRMAGDEDNKEEEEDKTKGKRKRDNQKWLHVEPPVRFSTEAAQFHAIVPSCWKSFGGSGKSIQTYYKMCIEYVY